MIVFFQRKSSVSDYIFQSFGNTIIEDRETFLVFHSKSRRRWGHFTRQITTTSPFSLFSLLQHSAHDVIQYGAHWPECPLFYFLSTYWFWTSVNEFSTAFVIEGCLDTLVPWISHLLYFLCNEAPAPANDKVTLNWWCLQSLLKLRCLEHRTLNVIICQHWVL